MSIRNSWTTRSPLRTRWETTIETWMFSSRSRVTEVRGPSRRVEVKRRCPVVWATLTLNLTAKASTSSIWAFYRVKVSRCLILSNRWWTTIKEQIRPKLQQPHTSTFTSQLSSLTTASRMENRRCKALAIQTTWRSTTGKASRQMDSNKVYRVGLASWTICSSARTKCQEVQMSTIACRICRNRNAPAAPRTYKHSIQIDSRRTQRSIVRAVNLACPRCKLARMWRRLATNLEPNLLIKTSSQLKSPAAPIMETRWLITLSKTPSSFSSHNTWYPLNKCQVASAECQRESTTQQWCPMELEIHRHTKSVWGCQWLHRVCSSHWSTPTRCITWTRTTSLSSSRNRASQWAHNPANRKIRAHRKEDTTAIAVAVLLTSNRSLAWPTQLGNPGVQWCMTSWRRKWTIGSEYIQIETYHLFD